MASTKTRSLTKAIIWEALGLLLLVALTGQWQLSVGYVALRVILYFLYERAWKLTRWGKS